MGTRLPVLDEITRQHFELALYRHFLYHYAYPPPSRWSYGLQGSLERRHAQTPCDFGFIRPRNVRCRQGTGPRAGMFGPRSRCIESRVENPLLQETELGGVFRPRPLGEIAFSFSSALARTTSYCTKGRHCEFSKWSSRKNSAQSDAGVLFRLAHGYSCMAMSTCTCLLRKTRVWAFILTEFIQHYARKTLQLYADCGLGRAAQSTRSHVFPQVGPLGFSSELFLRAFVANCDRFDLTLVPGHDLRAGAHRGQRRVCFLCATRYVMALKRDLPISHDLLQSDRCSSSGSFQLTRELR
jgi:hypothetical protein